MASAGKDMEHEKFTLLGGNANGHRPGKLCDSTYPRLNTRLPSKSGISRLTNVYTKFSKLHFILIETLGLIACEELVTHG